MNSEKWKFTEPDPKGKSAAQKERDGMIFLLIAGLILVAGGLFFAIKIGAFDLEYFWGLKREMPNYRQMRRTVAEYSIFFHAPWLIGVWMIITAAKSLFKNRRK